MTINDEMKIPYVSKEICKYLRETYSLPVLLGMCTSTKKDVNISLGFMFGVNEVIARLEAITVQQEENDGIH